MAEKRSNTGLIIAVIVIVVIVLLLLICCCLIGGCGPLLLGPNISDVFSQVNSALAAP